MFCRIYYSLIGSTDEDVLLLEESDENVYISLRHTKDFKFFTVNTLSPTSSKVKDVYCKLHQVKILHILYNNFNHFLGLSN